MKLQRSDMAHLLELTVGCSVWSACGGRLYEDRHDLWSDSSALLFASHCFGLQMTSLGAVPVTEPHEAMGCGSS